MLMRKTNKAGRTSLLLGVGLFLAACSASPPAEPPAPPPLDPTGEYSVTIDAQGQTIDGTLIIAGAAGAYTGSIDTPLGGAALSGVTLAGEEMTFSVDEVGITFTVVFDGDSFSGDFGGSMGAGTVFGVKTGG
jgi:hypothetical protein